MQIAAIGDLHFDKLDKLFGAETANKLIADEFDLALQWCYDNGIKHVVQLGDVAEHTRLSQYAHKLLLRLCHKWDGKLHLTFIRGNHDWAEEGVHSLEIMQELYSLGYYDTIKFVHDREQVELGGITCNFLSYPNIAPLPSQVQPLNFGHFEVAGSVRDNGRKIKEGLEVDPRHHYVLGHLHTPHTVGKAHFVGTLFQTNFGESMPKSFTVMDCSYRGKTLDVEYTRVKWKPAFELINAIIETEDDWADLKQGKRFWYKILVNEDVVVPADIGTRFNIVNTLAWSTDQELAILQTSDMMSLDTQGIPDIDPDLELLSWMKSKHSLSDVEAAKVVRFRDKLLGSVTKVTDE